MNRPSPDDMKAMWVMEYVEELEKEYKKLKEENKELKAYKSWYILLKERINGRIETQNELEKENKLLKAELFEIKRNTSYNFLRDELEITSNFEKRWDITLMRMKEAELREKYIEHLEQENKELKDKLRSFSL